MQVRSRSMSAGSRALLFVVLAVVMLFGAAGLAWGLIRFAGPAFAIDATSFQPAFVISTLLLGVGSFLLHRARQCVQFERQRPFRRRMLGSLVTAAGFMGVQTYGLWCLMGDADLAQTQTGVVAFIFVFVALHAMHFFVASLFLAFVTVQALCDRYDHEYYQGISVCLWFWHILGILWLCVLAVLAITW